MIPRFAPPEATPNHPWHRHKGDGIEDPNLPVRPHRGMNREEKQKRQHHTHDTDAGHQHQIKPPKTSAPPSFGQSQQGHQGKQAPCTLARRQRESLRRHDPTTFHDLVLARHQRTLIPRSIPDYGTIGIMQHVKRSKHLLPFRNRPVSLRAETQIVAQFSPRIMRRILMDDLTIRPHRVRLQVNHLALYGIFYPVTGPRRAIIIEVVITIFPVFRPHVLQQQRPKPPFLGRSEVQRLLIDRRTARRILPRETGKRFRAYLIIALPERETPDEMRLAKAEHAIVEHPILSCGIIADADARMPV